MSSASQAIPSVAPNRRYERARRARQRLIHLIDQANVGEALPTIVALQDHCGVGRRSVENLVGEFADDGILRREPGQGIFKVRERAAEQSTDAGTVEVIACGRRSDVHCSPFLDELIRCLAATAGDRERAIRLRQIAETEPPSAYEKLAESNTDADVILLGAHIGGLLAMFARRGRPAVALLPRYPQRGGPSVQPAGGLVTMQVRHLYEQGHRRIAMLDPVDPASPGWNMLLRREAYYREMARLGLAVGPYGTPAMGIAPAETVAGLRKVFNADPRPTALIVRDRVLPSVYAYLRGEGIEPGRDVSIMGTDDLPVACQVEPAATTVGFSRNHAAERCFATLEEVRRGHTADRTVLVPIKLTKRASTQPPADAPEDASAHVSHRSC